MAKKSAIEKNKRRIRLAALHLDRRMRLKAVAKNQSLPPEDRFAARLKLAAMPRDGAQVRVRNRCEISGRPRSYYRKFRVSRIALRELASRGEIPGMVKSSW